MDPWESILPKTDSTLRLIHEAALRQHTVGILYPKNLTIRNNVVYGFVEKMEKWEKVPVAIDSFHQKAVFKQQMLPLKGFDAIIIRKDPPLNATMLNFLDSLERDVFIMNGIHGIRKANNKLYTSTFNDPENKFLPVTYVSKSKEYLKKVISESESEKMILKPLAGFGGSGVIVLEKSATQNINSLLDFYIGDENKNYVIMQEYVEGAEQGDVRILLLGGEPIGAMRRVPATGDVRSNVHAGGRVERHRLTREEKSICRKIGPQLVADGLLFVGIDVIGGKLIEVNVLSPGGIVNINRLNKVKLQQEVLDFVEEKVEERELAFNQKATYKAQVRNA